MRKVILGLSIIVAGTFFSAFQPISQSHARVILKEKTKFYKVTGSTGADIYRSMT